MSTHRSQLDRAQLVATNFIPKDPPGSSYIYIYLGAASIDATTYDIIDGLALISGRTWHLDEQAITSVAYVGQGVRSRIGTARKHPVLPKLKQHRLKLFEALSDVDATELERLLILELGCILDDSRPDGCLVNTKLYQSGPNCNPNLRSEAAVYRQSKHNPRYIGAVCFDIDKNVVISGSQREVAEFVGVEQTCISKCVLGQRTGFYSDKLEMRLHACYPQDYPSFEVDISLVLKSEIERKLIHIREISTGKTYKGTVANLAQLLNIKDAYALHRVARGEMTRHKGFVASYSMDDLPSQQAASTELNHQQDRHQCVCFDAYKSIIFEGTRTEVIENLGIKRSVLANCMQKAQPNIYSPVLKRVIYVCSPNDFESFVPTANRFTTRPSRRLMFAQKLDGSMSAFGTAKGIAKRFGLKRSDGLHESAKSSGINSTQGCVAVYA